MKLTKYFILISYTIFFSLGCGSEELSEKQISKHEPSKKQTKTQSSLEDEIKSGRPMMKVGDKIIYEGYFQLLRSVIPNFNQNFATAEGRKQILNQIIEQELFLQKSEEEDLLKNSATLEKKLWLTRRGIIGGEYFLKFLQESAKEQYEKDKDKYYSSIEISDIVYYYQNMPGPTLEEQKAAARQQAENIREGLTAENFGEIAAQETQDPIAKSNYGQVGKISFIDQRVKQLDWGPVVAKAFQMEPGQISEPIETALGIHIIMVTGVKETQPYEHVASFIQSEIQAKVKEELLQKLLAEKKVEYLIEGLEPPPEEEKIEK